MLNRWSVLVLFLGVMIGYAFAGQSANAQSDTLPFGIGDRILLTYENEKSFLCVVGELRRIYVRCDPTGPTTGIGSRRSERWQSLESVVSIEKLQDRP